MLSRCTVWSRSIGIKWGEWLWTPELFASVCTETSFSLLPCLWFKTEPWSFISAFWVQWELPFHLWLLFIWGDESCLLQWYERVGVGTHFCLHASLWHGARKLLSRGYNGHSTVLKWVNNQCTMTGSIKRGEVKSSSCHKHSSNLHNWSSLYC